MFPRALSPHHRRVIIGPVSAEETPGKRQTEIRVDPHTLERAEERGTDQEEIQDVINTGFSIPARAGRLGKAKIYDFKQKRHGRFYEQKRVEVIYTVEKGVIVTVTVYVFYGKWEGQHADSI
jgi:hypothetical protein